MLKWLLITLTLVFVLQAQAQSSAGDSDSQSEPKAARSDDELVSALADEMKPFVKTLGREAMVFHYQDANSAGGAPVDDNDRSLPSRARARIAYFWQSDQTVTGSFYGDGFYAAMDPVVSRSYGGDDFKLITVKLHSWMKYYDDASSFYKEADDLKVRGCETTVANLLTQYGPCRDLILKALGRLHVDYLAYSWSSAIYNGCSYDNTRAFVLMNPRSFQDSDFDFYFKNIPNNDPHAGDREQIELYSRRMAMPVWPELSSSASEPDPAWLKKNIFNCSNLP